MTGKRTTTVRTEEELKPDDTAREEPQEEADPWDELGIPADLFQLTDARLEVLRYRNGRKKYLDALDPMEFSLQWLKETWGGGRYQIRIRKADGTFSKAGTVEIEGAPKSPDGEEDREPEPPPAPPDPMESPTVKMMVMMFGKMIDAMTTLKDVRNPPAPAHEQDPLVMALELVEKIRGLAPEPSAKDDMETFLQGLELGRSLEGSDGMAGTLRPLIPAIVRRLDTGDGPPAAPNPGTSAPPSSPSSPSTPEVVSMQERTAQYPDGAPPDWVHFLRPFVSQFITYAARDSDPGLYAELTLDQMHGRPDALGFLEDATHPDKLAVFLADFFQWNPECAAYSEWFTEYWGAVQEQFHGEAEPEEADVVDTAPPAPHDAGTGAASGASDEEEPTGE